MRKSTVWQQLQSTKRGRLMGGFLAIIVLALVAAGCAPASTGPATQPTAGQQPAVQATAPAATETVMPQVLPQTGATSAPATTGSGSGGAAGAPAAAGSALVNLAQKASFGLFLVDDKGMTLYEYTKDTSNASTCYDQCATAWPPLLTSGAPQAGPGVTLSLLGTTTRTDGKTQVTYSGHPLYYFAKDQKPGDINGQGVGGVWFVLSPRGGGMTNSKAPGPGTPQAYSVVKPQPTPSGPAQLGQSQNAELDQFLADAKGMTLYLYTKDTPNTSNCYDLCAILWPPYLTSGAPAAPAAGLDASLLGTTKRTDGNTQVTYNGWPLYYFARDQQPGDTKGQWVGGTWFAVSPKGEKITAGQPPATPAAGGTGGGAAPAATPQPAATSGSGYGGGSGY